MPTLNNQTSCKADEDAGWVVVELASRDVAKVLTGSEDLRPWDLHGGNAGRDG